MKGDFNGIAAKKCIKQIVPIVFRLKYVHEVTELFNRMQILSSVKEPLQLHSSHLIISTREVYIYI